MGVEIVGGLLADSLALLADGGHMLSDAGALALTLVAMRFARRPATSQRTYGSYRAEILAALVNGATLVAVGDLHLRGGGRAIQNAARDAGRPYAGSHLWRPL